MSHYRNYLEIVSSTAKGAVTSKKDTVMAKRDGNHWWKNDEGNHWWKTDGNHWWKRDGHQWW